MRLLMSVTLFVTCYVFHYYALGMLLTKPNTRLIQMTDMVGQDVMELLPEEFKQPLPVDYAEYVTFRRRMGETIAKIKDNKKMGIYYPSPSKSNVTFEVGRPPERREIFGTWSPVCVVYLSN